jgi:protein SCO1/2
LVQDDQGQTIKRYHDVILTDQDAQRHRFFEDLIKDRSVIIHTFFSSCSGACPKMLATLRKLQDRLGPRLGRDVVFVSLSVDPEVDTPERLTVLARQVEARLGWYFLTGDLTEVDGLVRKLQPEYSGKFSHTTRLFVGNLRTHTWAKPDIASFPEAKIIESAERIWGETPASTDP